jgi:hypothetical protein
MHTMYLLIQKCSLGKPKVILTLEHKNLAHIIKAKLGENGG